jgi:hypothetical protein
VRVAPDPCSSAPGELRRMPFEYMDTLYAHDTAFAA